ncbi:MAG: type IV pilin-like G/H family protein [Kastovskya adunca ATA6-11-RM4]|nr:type IV pilin-like G/H family protein [Kastovskya adunca ATA6-11-RM4]
MSNFRPLQANRISGKCLTFSFLLGLLFTFPTVDAQALPGRAIAQNTTQTSDVQAAQTRLRGQWEAKDSTSGQTLKLVFAEDGRFFMLLPFDEETNVALPLGYSIEPTFQPMHLDIKLPNAETVMTIFEFTADNQLRLQLADTSPGQPRPTAFASNAVLLEKISEETTLPEDTQILVDPEAQANDSRQEEAKVYVGALNRAQQAYYIEYGKFAQTIEDLGIGIEPETSDYRYEIVPQDDSQQSVIIAATAKRPESTSLTGAVFLVEVDEEDLTIAGICETEAPSSTPPAMPTISSDQAGEIQCPAGSRLVK